MNNYWADLIVNPGDYVGFLQDADGRWNVWSSPQMYDDETLNILLDLRTLDALSELPKKAKITAFVKVGMATEFPYNLRPDEKRLLPMKLDGANVSTRSVQVLMDLVAKGDVSGRRKTPEQEKADAERLDRQRVAEANRLKRLKTETDAKEAARREKKLVIETDIANLRETKAKLQGLQKDLNVLEMAQTKAAKAEIASGFKKSASAVFEQAVALYDNARTIDRSDRNENELFDANQLVSILRGLVEKMRGVNDGVNGFEFIGSLPNSLITNNPKELAEAYTKLGHTKRIRYLTSGNIDGTFSGLATPSTEQYVTLLENWIARAVLEKAGLRNNSDRPAYIAEFPVGTLKFDRTKLPARTKTDGEYDLKSFQDFLRTRFAASNTPLAGQIVNFLENI